MSKEGKETSQEHTEQKDRESLLQKKLFLFIKNFAFLKGKFRLSSGEISNYYIDVKRVSLYGEFLDVFSELVYHIAKREFSTRNFAGVELGAVPLVVSSVMKMWQKGEKSEGIIIRKKPKEHGTSKWIEGGKPEKVILLEDVITTGGTTMNAVEKLKEHNIEVEGIITIVDRGGVANIKEKMGGAENHPKVISIFHVSEFLMEKEEKEKENHR